MKRILLFLTIIGLFLSSCKDYLNTEPNGTFVASNAYSSSSLITAAVANLYVGLKNSNMYGQYYTNYLTAPTDESFFFSSGSTYNYTYFYNLPTDGTCIKNLWSNCYTYINAANTLLDNIDASASGKVDADVVRKAKGEAYFLRGYFYFMLTQWFGGVPLILHSVDDPTAVLIARSTEKVGYDQVIADMIKADSMLYDQTYSSLGYSDKITQDAVQGILARVFLYAAGNPVYGTSKYSQSECYHQAAVWASKLIKGGKHSLMSDYKNIFINECQGLYNSENIWEIGFLQSGVGTTSPSGTTGVYCGPTHSYLRSSTTDDYDGYCYNYLRPQPRLYLSYEDGDYRRDWNCVNFTYKNSGYSTTASSYYNDAKVPLDTSKIWSRAAGKWRREYETSGRYVKASSGINFPVLRYADVLLMYAEALNEIDSTTVNGCSLTRDAAINMVRARSISTTQILDHISWISGTGYTADPTVLISGGGGTGAEITVASQYLISTPTSRTINLLLTAQGSGYTSTPTIVVGNVWTTNTGYTVGTQVAGGIVDATTGKRYLYTVTTAGTTSGTTGPTASSGTVTSGTVKFTYAGIASTAKAFLSPARTSAVALAGLGKEDFRAAIQMERFHELCFEALRVQDLRRWGILISTLKDLGNDVTASNLNGFYIKNLAGGNSAYYQRFKWKMTVPSTSDLNANSNDATYVTNCVMYVANNIGTEDLYWPIPQTEINLDYLITQNPGY